MKLLSKHNQTPIQYIEYEKHNWEHESAFSVNHLSELLW